MNKRKMIDADFKLWEPIDRMKRERMPDRDIRRNLGDDVFEAIVRLALYVGDDAALAYVGGLRDALLVDDMERALRARHRLIEGQS